MGTPYRGAEAGEFAAGGDTARTISSAIADRQPDSSEDHKLQMRAIEPPHTPTNIERSGLTSATVQELILKTLYLSDRQYGVEIARELRLPFQVIEAPLRVLKDEKLLEVPSGHPIGPASYQFQLTQMGRTRSHEAFTRCRYVGPAPVPLSDYEEQCRRQSVAGLRCTPNSLGKAFSDLIMRRDLLAELGPAVCSGRSVFLYGPPGNGKSMVARGLGRYLNHYGGEIFIPYAIEAEGAIVTMFDPTLHKAVDGDVASQPAGSAETLGMGNEGNIDTRWRRIRRPVIITGGELTLDMLDLRYNAESNIHTAPMHVKANGGVFLIDDFGRQIVSPRDLLNRWILPLEERIDYLTLATGKKFAVPFEQMIVFSTNLDPRELVDEAFLRRIRNKIKIGPPDRDHFGDIFKFHCKSREIRYVPEAVDFLYSNYYDRGKTPRSSDARDLLETIISICRYENRPVRLTPELMAEATKRFFCQL
ncbi:hypothetical protein Pan189_28120 [Stratiformator vulcanicus]|uniref:AAA+ ATPase domain-containing protein n=2 Tax=Stratiformator vulcanicus TaxID=2527980 RepID=A0A517R3E6_9PLAN|nr:hypothetical protein Pan189_28120 [Stratiformator vulcanicus]